MSKKDSQPQGGAGRSGRPDSAGSQGGAARAEPSALRDEAGLAGAETAMVHATDTDASDLPYRATPFSLVVLRRTLSGWGARLGLIWLLLMAVCALFAPFLANSHPLAMWTADGEVSSPLLRHLRWQDVALLAIAAEIAIVLLWRPLTPGRNVLLMLAGIVATAIICYATITPPQAIVYETYREGIASGEITRTITAPLPYSPADRLRDHPELRLTGPTSEHPMGTTLNGADLASNMIHATRIALSIGFIATGIALLIGILIGGLMGYFSGIVDLLGMRLVEIFSAIPTLLLLMAFVAAFGANLYIMMIIIGCTSWPGYAVFVRAEFLKLRKQDFVQATRALGLPLTSILFRHMLPNGVAPILVSACFSVAGAILTESTLSFLGIGLVDEASWGNLLNQALAEGGTFHWWIALYPGLAIFLTVFAYNLIGEAMRDAIDPKTIAKE